jgi:tetratricopeptide (TPR) repeat protein
MRVGGSVFVGRRTELAHGERAIASALSGTGALLLFFGEAGLGKTCVAHAIANAAAQRGARVVWGRAWEAGGAPSYWPWVQIFRALGAKDDPFPADALGNLEVPQARFGRFDRAARCLRSEAEERALTIVLDDLHAADLPSLLFLQFLVRERIGVRLLVVGTYRDVEARRSPEVEQILARIAREGEAIALDRLSKDDVLEWLCQASGKTATEMRAEADDLHAMTEGNALFVHELLRVHGRASPASASKSAGLRAILDEHLGRVSSPTREILQCASVLGRELEPSIVALLAERSAGDVERALREAEDLGLVDAIAGGERVSFSHILLRERLYADLLPSRRAALHTIAADAILSSGGDAATATHHLFESAAPPERMGRVAQRAAALALARLAFEDAVALLERALSKLSSKEHDTLAMELEIMLGEALTRIGRLSAAREVCVRAYGRAEALGLRERQAEAALVYALELQAGTIDPTMVRLLRTAHDALPPEDSPLLARVRARLASALVPCLTRAAYDEVLSLSASAIEMARRTADKEALFYALHFGGAAAGYLVPARTRAENAREAMEVAESLGRPHATLFVSGWYISTCREEGRVAESEAALAKHEALLRDHPLPTYRWRLACLRATMAALAGDFERADRLQADVLAQCDSAEFSPGLLAWVMLRMSIAHLRGDPKSIASDAERIRALAGSVIGARGFVAWLLAATGERSAARAILIELMATPSMFPWLAVGGETVCMLEDSALAEQVYPVLSARAAESSFFWAGYGAVVFGPLERVAGDVAAFLGRTDEARRWYDRAIALGERMQAPGIVDLAARRRDALSRRVTPGVSPSSISLRKEGEMWILTSNAGTSMHLKDSKGLAYLSHLLARPGQELHVTQIAELADVSEDAGAVLDGRAKAAYRSRLEALRDALEEAERFGDPTRAAAVQGEIDAIADQLAGAVGLGGRDRKLGSHVERVRINVQRRLRDAVHRIAATDPALGRYLDATIKTGVFCMFLPI